MPSGEGDAVTITIQGKQYRIGADPEAADAIRAHAAMIDANAEELAEEFGEMPKGYLIVVASILAMDQIASRYQNCRTVVDEAAEYVNDLTERVRRIAERFQA